MGIAAGSEDLSGNVPSTPMIVRAVVLAIALALAIAGDFIAAALVVLASAIDLVGSIAQRRVSSHETRRRAEAFRAAAVFTLMAALAVFAVGMALGRDGAISLLVALLLGLVAGLALYVAFFNLQIGRARRMLTRVIPVEDIDTTLVGVLAPGRIWLGNGLILGVGRGLLVGVSVPLGDPVVTLQLSVEQIRNVDTRPKRMFSLVTIEAPDAVVSVHASPAEVDDMARSLR